MVILPSDPLGIEINPSRETQSFLSKLKDLDENKPTLPPIGNDKENYRLKRYYNNPSQQRIKLSLQEGNLNLFTCLLKERVEPFDYYQYLIDVIKYNKGSHYDLIVFLFNSKDKLIYTHVPMGKCLYDAFSFNFTNKEGANKAVNNYHQRIYNAIVKSYYQNRINQIQLEELLLLSIENYGYYFFDDHDSQTKMEKKSFTVKNLIVRSLKDSTLIPIFETLYRLFYLFEGTQSTKLISLIVQSYDSQYSNENKDETKSINRYREDFARSFIHLITLGHHQLLSLIIKITPLSLHQTLIKNMDQAHNNFRFKQLEEFTESDYHHEHVSMEYKFIPKLIITKSFKQVEEHKYYKIKIDSKRYYQTFILFLNFLNSIFPRLPFDVESNVEIIKEKEVKSKVKSNIGVESEEKEVNSKQANKQQILKYRFHNLMMIIYFYICIFNTKVDPFSIYNFLKLDNNYLQLYQGNEKDDYQFPNLFILKYLEAKYKIKTDDDFVESFKFYLIEHRMIINHDGTHLTSL